MSGKAGRSRVRGQEFRKLNYSLVKAAPQMRIDISKTLLQDAIVSCSHFIGDDCVSKLDDAQSHVSRILDEVDVERIVWLACSPDVNPIKHIVVKVQRRILCRLALPLQFLNLVNSMPRL